MMRETLPLADMIAFKVVLKHYYSSPALYLMFIGQIEKPLFVA